LRRYFCDSGRPMIFGGHRHVLPEVAHLQRYRCTATEKETALSPTALCPATVIELLFQNCFSSIRASLGDA
jgi:hypothetical protein